jgi:alanyl-tRNA synthetase
VDQDWLRFDFTNLAPIPPEQLEAVERDSNVRIAAGEPISAQVLPLADAKEAGAMMLFGEKYPDPVRMVSMGDFSRELCGGTHLSNTKDVLGLEITSEEGVAAGVRRIVALTGEKAHEHVERTTSAICDTAQRLDVSPLGVPQAIRALSQRVRELKKCLAGGGQNAAEHKSSTSSLGKPTDEVLYADAKSALRETARLLNVSLFDVPSRTASLRKEVEDLERQIAQLSKSGRMSADDLLADAQQFGDTRVVVAEIPGGNPNLMRQLIDQIRKKCDSAAVLLAAAIGSEKVVLVAGMTHDLVQRGVKAGDWVRQVAPVVGGGGGGKPDMAQAGGKQPDNLPAAIEKARAVIQQQLQ